MAGTVRLFDVQARWIFGSGDVFFEEDVDVEFSEVAFSDVLQAFDAESFEGASSSFEGASSSTFDVEFSSSTCL